MSIESARNALLNADLSHYSADTRHLIHAQQATLPDGQRIITVENAAGLHLSLLPDRGLDIWNATYQNVPLTWLSPGSPHPPNFSPGWLWLQQFNGGLLTTCGITHSGPPETDPDTGEQRVMHGQYSNLRAKDVRVVPLDDGKMIEISGTMWESSLFGVQLALRRSYYFRFDDPAVHIRDKITNHGDNPAPLMLLYHINFGFPVVREGTEMLTASEVYPRDEAAREGIHRWQMYDAPSVQYPEQVFWHKPLTDSSGLAYAALINDGFGVGISWESATLPYLTQWKNTRQTHHVCGIEPGTCLPEGQNAARAGNRLMTINAGDTHETMLSIRVLPDADTVASYRQVVESVKQNGTLVSGYSLDAFKG